MADIHRIDDKPGAIALADLLNGSKRQRPVVVVTSPASRDEPWIDVEQIANEAGKLADVFLMPTNVVSWEFASRLPHGTQVFGGAGRVYPVGHDWVRDQTVSPLRFAFRAEDGVAATSLLISDMFRMAASAGILNSYPGKQETQVDGVVSLLVASRALVDIGRSMPATIVEELTVEGISIERLFLPGQRISGGYDSETNRIDVRKSFRSAEEALKEYWVGDVVLTQVFQVHEETAELLLYPETAEQAVTVTISLSDVTTNPYDQLSDLMTVGEVIPARIVAAAPAWQLVLHDVDDDEPITPAPALFDGGPSWLVEEAAEQLVGEQDDAFVAPIMSAQGTDPSFPENALLTQAAVQTAGASYPVEHQTQPAITSPSPESAEPATGVRAVPQAAKPTPALFDKSRPKTCGTYTNQAEQVSPKSAGTKELLSTIDGLKAEVRRLERKQIELTLENRAAVDECIQLNYQLKSCTASRNQAESDLKGARKRLRKAGSKKSNESGRVGPSFADPEQGFRYQVLTQWATRIPLNEQASKPLPEYVFGPQFFDSLDNLEGITMDKVADVVFEIVTGLAQKSGSRQAHKLRSGPGGDDPVRVRADGATAWRASLQVGVPSARRIHYWVLSNGPIEFAKVGLHDDFTI